MAICGTVRNSGPSLHKNLQVIDGIKEASAATVVVIVTNDNIDDTARILANWSENRPYSTVVTCDGLELAYPGRVDRLAAARNIYLDVLQAQAEYYDVLAVLDLDGPNENITPDKLIEACLGAPSDWIGLFANQTVAYYDLMALRHPIWMKGDVWQEVAEANASTRTVLIRLVDGIVGGRLGRNIYREIVRTYVHERQYCISPEHPLIKVESAFGGLGLYRYDAILSARYSSRTSLGEAVCEHVLFNDALRARGGAFYICPAMLNLAPSEHLGPGSGAPFPMLLGAQ